MKYLTIDTTTKVTALALADSGKLVAEGFLHSQKTHSERLIPMLDQLLGAAAWKLEDLNFIGVVRGPGSFTGIRIGIATAQGFAQVWKLPLVGVLSLDSLAWSGFSRKEEIVPILDARKNEWYTARYRWSEIEQRPICMAEPLAIEPALWLEELGQLERNIVFVGDAVLRYSSLIQEKLGQKAIILPDYLALPRGAYTVQCVWEEWSKKQYGVQVEPFYIRPSEAEVTWAKKEEARKRDGAH
jgi:tRNA threonylcarbamoyladenosine biosynthesis protein TsaB